jgi:hypothetical protein
MVPLIAACQIAALRLGKKGSVPFIIFLPPSLFALKEKIKGTKGTDPFFSHFFSQTIQPLVAFPINNPQAMEQIPSQPQHR